MFFRNITETYLVFARADSCLVLSKEKQRPQLVRCRGVIAGWSEPLPACSSKVAVVKGASLGLQRIHILREELQAGEPRTNSSHNQVLFGASGVLTIEKSHLQI